MRAGSGAAATPYRVRVLGIALLALLLADGARAERMQRLGGYEVHYSLIPTLMLKPEIAAGYGISRGRDRALLNLSIIDPDQGPVQVSLQGTARDLLGLVRPLEFREVTEGQAVYYLATLRHDDQEVLRFVVDIDTPDGRSQRLDFQQKMYREAP